MQYESSTTALSTYAADSMSPQSNKPYSLNVRYPAHTPPPSTSPIELPPILDMCDPFTVDRPPSPTSPSMTKRDDFLFSLPSPPAFLEPAPQLNSHASFVFPPFKEALESIQLQNQYYQYQGVHMPIPRCSSHQAFAPTQSNPATGDSEGEDPRDGRSYSPTSSSTTSSMSTISGPISRRLPISPTMAAASASAASAAHHRSGSLVTDTLVNALRLTTPDNHEPLVVDLSSPSYTRVSFMVHGNPVSMDQSMFLTKNAHIKRPRNAWIHFRCHYGQALKSQDPTLRAEEISKRASRRWAKLTEREKKPWHDLAEQEKQAHKEAFPEYRYSPKRGLTHISLTDPDDTESSVRHKRARRTK
ncbi:hypothetical protein J3Q64DRAFT_1748966 [Phycomyces blakesleeanus]|uniref:HMG box domain-containing protein n=2 Tax=Phycomyces blakesleeanus TaxID=4837 RepID=A0A162UBP7_PHYB8|nr:hypothetical protein PHYBLDRAFT_77877 [Phycomyces blakesleeanus NRRL 1555(-)]OAD73893.1 hypothetical protein PHYBLDRAFT_77877 [Phycomyces blakesleeanus NRRL 1555(-)]|eukprot:XP_018291933.1 hypothetical protein PHYBLDRAFT_77877 [Phycomyces blakesleeanus NRRL 1555(-)]